MHETIESGREAIANAQRLMFDASTWIESLCTVHCLMSECVNELTRLCLDSHKKILHHLLDFDDKNVQEVRDLLHSIGFFTAITDHSDDFRALIVATKQIDLDFWLRHNLGVFNDIDKDHPFLVGWMLGYPTTSIEDAWEGRLPNLSRLLRQDMQIYKDELGYDPVYSVGFNWKYELPA